MKSTKTTKILVMLILVPVFLGMASAEQTKKKKLTVTVEENESCANGISVSDQSWGDRQLCADNPNVAAGYLRSYIGQAVEIEAQWSFAGDPKTDFPDNLNKVLKVGGSRVVDPCAVSKVGFIAGMVYAAGGGDVDTATNMALPNCNPGSDQ
jgi:hypothetical protein